MAGHTFCSRTNSGSPSARWSLLEQISREVGLYWGGKRFAQGRYYEPWSEECTSHDIFRMWVPEEKDVAVFAPLISKLYLSM